MAVTKEKALGFLMDYASSLEKNPDWGISDIFAEASMIADKILKDNKKNAETKKTKKTAKNTKKV